MFDNQREGFSERELLNKMIHYYFGPMYYFGNTQR